MKIAALLTCHNRREQTLACLRRLESQQLSSEIQLNIVIMDDGSTDDTSEAVSREFPEVTILRGNGSLYWCGGMRIAWKEAAANDPDYYLLLNDDTLMYEGAVGSLLEIAGSPDSRTIAVAAIRDPETGARTYGGIRGFCAGVGISGRPEICDTFNANAVLIPREVYHELGVFDTVYTHAMGDHDYGYEATRRGIRVIQSPESLGTCSHNALAGTWKDKSLSRLERFKKLQSPKGLPWKEWVIYNRRNAGWIWPWRCISPILRILCGR